MFHQACWTYSESSMKMLNGKNLSQQQHKIFLQLVVKLERKYIYISSNVPLKIASWPWSHMAVVSHTKATVSIHQTCMTILSNCSLLHHYPGPLGDLGHYYWHLPLETTLFWSLHRGIKIFVSTAQYWCFLRCLKAWEMQKKSLKI